MIRSACSVLWLLLLSTACTANAVRADAGSPSPTPQSGQVTTAPLESALVTPAISPTASSALATSPAPLPTVASLRAIVTVHLLSCRYGPGPEYLYLYALRGGANITLIGRADGDNWHWAWVEGQNRCWVNTSYLRVDGDWRQLPIVYPGLARLPISPYYPPTSITSVVRRGTLVTVEWRDIGLRAGDEEDQYMQHYVIETWHCRGGQLIFEPLATNYSFITFVDEPGCVEPSHGRVFVQEKHGFSGPTEIPWPPLK